MAKQVGSKKITGTIDGICFYIREGAYLARAESSLDTKRYYSDPAFEGSRKSNERMTKASPMASKLYKQIKKEDKGRPVFNKLVGRIKVKIKEGWDERRIETWFMEAYRDSLIKPVAIPSKKKIPVNKIPPFAKFDIPRRLRKRFFRVRIINGGINNSPGVIWKTKRYGNRDWVNDPGSDNLKHIKISLDNTS